MKKEMRKEMKIGMLCGSIYLMMNHFRNYPDTLPWIHFLQGILFGCWMFFLILSLIPKERLDELKKKKRKLFHG